MPNLFRELLKIRLNKSASSCEHVKDVTARKLTEVTEKIAELEVFRQALKSLHDRCCGGSETASHCTILQALDAFDGEPELVIENA